MKVLNRLTIKHLMMNKKRTIVTIIGIVLSTALMVGIGLLMSTFLNSMREDAIQYHGTYHVSFAELSLEEKETLKLNVNFSENYSYGIVGYSKIYSKNFYKPYLYIVSADTNYFEHEELIEGRFPINNNEIVLSNHLRTNGEVEYHVGDEITLEVGYREIDGEEVYDNSVSFVTESRYVNRNLEDVEQESFVPLKSKTYQVVGIVNRSIEEDYSSPGYMAFTTKEDDIISYKFFAQYKNAKKAYDITGEICDTLSSYATCSTNDRLLYYYGVSRYSNVNRTLVSVMSIFLALLSVGCIIVIYNSFAISAMERKKSFGLYSSLGASPKQIKYTVFFEAFLVGVIGIFLGILSAFFGIYVTIHILDYLIKDAWGMNLKFVVEPLYIFIPIVFMIFVVYFSAFLPARRSSKVSSIEMIRENDEIKIPRRKVRTPKWIRKVFGMEGEIALKNMKRNKRKYRITLLAIFISIVLFISFSTYLTLGLRITEIGDIVSYDVYVSSNNKNTVDEIIQRGDVEQAYRIQQLLLDFRMFDKSYYQPTFYDYYENVSDVKENKYTVVSVILEDKDFEKLSQDNNPVFLNQLDYTFYQDNTRRSYQTKIFLKDVSELTLCGYEQDVDNEFCEKVKISLLNEKVDFLKNLPIDTNLPILFVSKSMTKEYVSFQTNDSFEYVSIISKNYRDLYEEVDKRYSSQAGFYVYSPKIELEAQKNSMLAIKILLYGFITLVTLTGVTSVFNTIHTSIHLRRREFAMLRSVGLSPKGFTKMILFESLFFGLKALVFALPVSFALIYLINITIGDTFYFGGVVIPWTSVFFAIFGVFLIVLLTMWYSVSKIRKENILNSLRDENI